MKTGLSTPTYDLDGAKMFLNDPSTEQKNNTGGRRGSVTATLDGGCVVYDNGYSASDRKYVAKIRDDSGTIATWAERIVKNYTSMLISTSLGFFRGRPARWWVDENMVSIEFQITEELN